MLQVDDITVGDYITVLEYVCNPSDHSFQGEVLHVIAVDLPYIVVNGMKSHTQNMHMDIRRWKFKRCSDEYVHAAKAAGGGDESA